MEGTPFGRYRLIELLGRGGMGEVWRAHDTDTDRIVAIKLLPVHFSENEEFQKRFRREAHAAAQLNSPHVVPIHHYGEIDGRLYVDMRLIEGRDLQSVLADGPLEPRRAVRIIEGVALALHAAHEVGLVHRDVKPSNILLDRNDFAYLIDFGIAHVAEDTRMTKTGNTIGTFAYIAPERLDGRGDEDARVDIYSLACVLYECLAGEPPFRGDTMARLVAAHLNTPPPRPSIARSDVPAQVDEVIATGMAKDPDQRYATTVELANAANDAITTPIGLPAQSLAARTAFVTPEAPTVSATEAAAAQQQAADLNLAETDQGDGPPAETSTPPGGRWWPPRGRSALIAATIVAVVVLAAGFIIFRPQPSRPPATSAASTTQPAPAPTLPKLIEQPALDSLLLTPDQINAAMGATGMTIAETPPTLEEAAATVPDRACLQLQGNLIALAYAGSGWAASREQVLYKPGDEWTHWADQGVVLFSSAHDADAFFTTSAQQWPACANRQYTFTATGKRGQLEAAGPVSNANGTLSATVTEVATSWTCQRALTVANNVVIDIRACAYKGSNSPSDAGVTIAHQIAAKVPTT